MSNDWRKVVRKVDWKADWKAERKVWKWAFKKVKRTRKLQMPVR